MRAGEMWPRILLVLAGGVVVGGVLAAAPPAADGVAPLPLTATPVPLAPRDPAVRDVGRLRYMGGVELQSTNVTFGGLSGLAAGRDGWLLAVSDTGNWVGFRTVEKHGRLVGVTDGVIAPLLDEIGGAALVKKAGDAEAVVWDADGTASVSFEQDDRIAVYPRIDPARPDSLRTRAARIIRTPATSGWPDNGGGETLVRLSDGTLLWFAEDGQDAEGRSPALRIAPDGTVSALLYAAPTGFRPTDAAEVAPGRVLIVNRRFTPMEGMSAVVTLATVAPVMQGEVVARLVPPLTTDNMEGIAVMRADGRTFVYLASDDNFAGYQRTLLLKFELLNASPASARRP
ncbi:esterase-like activity of phytase family protein [Glacieibacterium frigidum]|uniref:Phytase-like domain-containing protein n=1 Tax=Glacieibacterium frigidum TaxID=2593303 RepID=A0A552UG48_9SPHN|nr:esterase-like activity of phytase family protein [Glacieibacterium frigidum]TRW17185.1 hypothetical protein FMM06_03005 [Glacieibacterium frigidum]